MSNPIDLNAIRVRAGTATPGPWKSEDLASDGHPGVFWVSMDSPTRVKTVASTYPGESGVEVIWSMDDAEFIAHAREDVPALLLYIEKLHARIEFMEEQEAGLRDDITTLESELRKLDASLPALSGYQREEDCVTAEWAQAIWSGEEEFVVRKRLAAHPSWHEVDEGHFMVMRSVLPWVRIGEQVRYE